MKHALGTRIGWTALALTLALPATGWADITDKVLTIPIGSSVNMETGAVVTSGGDLKWDGTSLTPQGGAKAAYVGPGDALYQTLTQQFLQASAGTLVSTAPVPVGGLTGGSVLAVLTTAGHWGKLEVTVTTAPANSALPIKITTFGAGSGGGGGGPTITSVLNNSSNIPSGFPNSGISQGALFKVLGSNLAEDGDATLHDSQASGGLPTTLNGAKITVTVGSTTVNVALYYATPTQIDGVLPANTPTGSGTLTVTHNGTPSSAFSILVVTAAPGITTYQNGTAVAQDFARPTDPFGGLVTFLKSAPPGGIMTIWGSGFGATGNSDTTFDTSGHQTSVPYQIYIGGVQVTNISYKGNSVYPGVSIFVLTIPQGVPTGCYVPIAAVTGNVVSNIATLPIAAGGGVCSDPQLGISGDQLTTISQQTNFKSGSVSVVQSTSPGVGGNSTTFSGASGSFSQFSGTLSTGGLQVSFGGCVVLPSTAGSGGSTGTSTPLDPGTVTVTPPGGGAITMTGNALVPGVLLATLPAIPSTGGSYVFNGAGGAQVGKFTATVNFPNPLLTWTNQPAAATVNRSQGLQVTWSGGASGTYVGITGNSATASGASATYLCLAPVAAGQFTVPSYVLLSLPTGTGSTSVESTTSPTLFSASGLDLGSAVGIVLVSANSTYN